MALSKEDEARIADGVAQFVAAVNETNRGRGVVGGPQGIPGGGFLRGVVRPTPTTRTRISPALVASITEDQFAEEGEALAFSTEEEGLQRAGKSLWQCVLAALRRRLCGKEEAKKKVDDAIKKAKLTDPSMLSVGAASVVAVAIGSLFAGPIAVAAAPVLGGLAYLLIASGVDGFCEWEDEPPPEEPEQGRGESKPKPRRKPKPKPKPSNKKPKAKSGKR